jgi:mono/diheme cytochrome c family protein
LWFTIRPWWLRGSPPRRRAVVAVRTACLAAFVVVGQDHPATPHGHPEGQMLQNPVAATPASVEAGAKQYAKLCANCHGTSGRGNGRLAAGTAMYGARPSDLADDVWQHGSTDGEVFLVIRDGVGPDFHMDAFGRAMPEEDIWNVVNYIKTLAIKKY